MIWALLPEIKPMMMMMMISSLCECTLLIENRTGVMLYAMYYISPTRTQCGDVYSTARATDNILHRVYFRIFLFLISLCVSCCAVQYWIPVMCRCISWTSGPMNFVTWLPHPIRHIILWICHFSSYIIWYQFDVFNILPRVLYIYKIIGLVIRHWNFLPRKLKLRKLPFSKLLERI